MSTLNDSISIARKFVNPNTPKVLRENEEVPAEGGHRTMLGLASAKQRSGAVNPYLPVEPFKDAEKPAFDPVKSYGQ